MKYWGYESRANGKHVLLLDFWLTIGPGAGQFGPAEREGNGGLSVAGSQ